VNGDYSGTAKIKNNKNKNIIVKVKNRSKRASYKLYSIFQIFRTLIIAQPHLIGKRNYLMW